MSLCSDLISISIPESKNIKRWLIADFPENTF